MHNVANLPNAPAKPWLKLLIVAVFAGGLTTFFMLGGNRWLSTARTYVAATAIGILPGSVVFTNLGQSLGRIESPDQLVSTETLLALGLLGLFALIPIMVKRFNVRQSAA